MANLHFWRSQRNESELPVGCLKVAQRATCQDLMAEIKSKVEGFPSIHEALDSIPGIAKKKNHDLTAVNSGMGQRQWLEPFIERTKPLCSEMLQVALS